MLGSIIQFFPPCRVSILDLYFSHQVDDFRVKPSKNISAWRKISSTKKWGRRLEFSAKLELLSERSPFLLDPKTLYICTRRSFQFILPMNFQHSISYRKPKMYRPAKLCCNVLWFGRQGRRQRKPVHGQADLPEKASTGGYPRDGSSPQRGRFKSRAATERKLIRCMDQVLNRGKLGRLVNWKISKYESSGVWFVNCICRWGQLHNHHLWLLIIRRDFVKTHWGFWTVHRRCCVCCCLTSADECDC